jgi:hypothetical protein
VDEVDLVDGVDGNGTDTLSEVGCSEIWFDVIDNTMIIYGRKVYGFCRKTTESVPKMHDIALICTGFAPYSSVEFERDYSRKLLNSNNIRRSLLDRKPHGKWSERLFW